MAANGVSGPHGTDRTGLNPSVPAVVDLDQIHFGDVLETLNPLQYVPVVGTIYRLVTGEAAPSAAHTAISVLAGAITGGPIGLIGSIAGAVAENVLHVEDRLAQALAPRVTEAYRSAGMLGAV